MISYLLSITELDSTQFKLNVKKRRCTHKSMLFIRSSAILSIHLRGIQWSQRNCRNPFLFNAYYHNFIKLIVIKWCPNDGLYVELNESPKINCCIMTSYSILNVTLTLNGVSIKSTQLLSYPYHWREIHWASCNWKKFLYIQCFLPRLIEAQCYWVDSVR